MKSEEKIIKSIDNDEWVSVENKDELLKSFGLAAKNTMNKDQRMNIRISKRDLINLKTRAMEEGLPYQTLVSSIIHKYLNGSLKENKV